MLWLLERNVEANPQPFRVTQDSKTVRIKTLVCGDYEVSPGFVMLPQVSLEPILGSMTQK